jgi:hypothetical protein
LSCTVPESEKKRRPSLPQSRADPGLRRMLPSTLACRNSPAPEVRRRVLYRLINHAISETTALTISIVVIE